MTRLLLRTRRGYFPQTLVWILLVLVVMLYGADVPQSSGPDGPNGTSNMEECHTCYAPEIKHIRMFWAKNREANEGSFPVFLHKFASYLENSKKASTKKLHNQIKSYFHCVQACAFRYTKRGITARRRTAPRQIEGISSLFRKSGSIYSMPERFHFDGNKYPLEEMYEMNEQPSNQ